MSLSLELTLIAEFLLLLFFLYAGSRFGGIGLGVVSGIGLMFEVLVLRMPPGKAPIDVMLVILAVVTCASVLEAAGGLKYMLQIAEKILRKNPKRVTILGPIVTYTMTIMLGTGHAVYSIMPIIGDIALKNKIRPERPMAAASVASQLAITGYPRYFRRDDCPVALQSAPWQGVAGRSGISTPHARPRLARPHFKHHQHHAERATATRRTQFRLALYPRAGVHRHRGDGAFHPYHSRHGKSD